MSGRILDFVIASYSALLNLYESIRMMRSSRQEYGEGGWNIEKETREVGELCTEGLTRERGLPERAVNQEESRKSVPEALGSLQLAWKMSTNIMAIDSYYQAI